MVLKTQEIHKLHGLKSRVNNFQQEVRKRMWQQRENPMRHTWPAFLVGCGRSGMSMLVYHLGKAWPVDLYNENNPAAFQNFRLRDLSVIEDLVQRSFARVALFKPILNTTETLALLDRFPDARVIFTFRHYSDVINSSIKKFGVMNRIGHVKAWIEEDFGEFTAYPPPEETKIYIRSNWTADMSPESGAALYWLFYNRLYFVIMHWDPARGSTHGSHHDYDTHVPLISGDGVQLKQSFLNILTNAVQAMLPEGGELRLGTALNQKKNELQIFFSDTGQGIPKEYLNKVFLPFFTLGNNPGRYGLGLSFAYQIIKNHDGHLKVESQAGAGTVFTVVLPLRSET